MFFCTQNLPTNYVVYGSICISEEGCLVLNKLVVEIRILVLELRLKFNNAYFDEKQVITVLLCCFSSIQVWFKISRDFSFMVSFFAICFHLYLLSSRGLFS